MCFIGCYSDHMSVMVYLALHGEKPGYMNRYIDTGLYYIVFGSIVQSFSVSLIISEYRLPLQPSSVWISSLHFVTIRRLWLKISNNIITAEYCYPGLQCY